MALRFGFVLLLFLTVASNAVAQSDSLRKAYQTDSIPRKARSIRDPRRATMLSAVLPGAGQIYNRKYWKLPIVYGGSFLLGYYIRFNHQEYRLTRDSYLQVKAGQPDYYNGAYTAEQLVQLREYWRRNRDLLIIVSGFVYLLNVADAAVDAHLSGFDVGDDLSLKIQPTLFPLPGNLPGAGLQATFSFSSNLKKPPRYVN